MSMGASTAGGAREATRGALVRSQAVLNVCGSTHCKEVWNQAVKKGQPSIL